MMKTLIAAGVLSGMTATAALAAPMSYTVGDSFSGGTFPTSGAFTVDKFDTSYGDLISATYLITFGVDSTGTVQNQSGATGTYTFSLNTFVNFTGLYSEFIMDSESETYNIASGATENVSVSYSDNRTGGIAILDAEGPGTFSLNYSLSGSAGASGPTPFVFTSTGSTTNVDLLVTYVYNVDTPEVPLPAALPLLGGGLALMGFVVRRRCG